MAVEIGRGILFIRTPPNVVLLIYENGPNLHSPSGLHVTNKICLMRNFNLSNLMTRNPIVVDDI